MHTTVLNKDLKQKNTIPENVAYTICPESRVLRFSYTFFDGESDLSTCQALLNFHRRRNKFIHRRNKILQWCTPLGNLEYNI